MGQIIVHNTRGKDHVERASLAFVTGNAARTSGQEAVVLLTIEGVRIATQGYADSLQAEGFAPLTELLDQFVESGGRIWICGACANARKITEDDLVEGAQIIGAATVIETLVNGAQTLSL